ncbi:hypothetical protein [Pseudonocardia sp.]|uniref:hypothetical protein n=1 Tax=Pseudonocardia sp. TaxID=60912 RepID=UPI0026382FCE|nr:hypothetical protein [Pseudonocardia sp.]
MTGPGCGTHAGLGTELRAVAVLALDRLGPVLDRVRSEPGAPQSAEACAVCPICALVALLRGERPELAVRLAEHASGLLAVLQAALHEGDPAAWPPPPAPTPPARPDPARPPRRVQHIRIERPVSC